MAQTKFDIKTEVTRPLYAYVGVTDRAVEAVRGSVGEWQKRLADVQKSVTDIDLEPKALRGQATTIVNGRVEAISKDAQARRAAIEARVAELQDRLRALLKESEATYDQLVVRGETLVERIRRQQSTQDAVKSAKTSTTKAKTTRTQATKSTKSTAKTAKKTAKRATKSTAAEARKRSQAPQSSAKATATTAKRAARSATKAASQGAQKVGD